MRSLYIVWSVHPGRKARAMVRKRQVPNLPRGGRVVTSAPAGGVKPKKKPRFRPGTLALREIRKYQQSTKVKIRPLVFMRLVRDSGRLLKSNLRFGRHAVHAFQEVTEYHLISLLEDAYFCCIHRKRVTLSAVDIRLARRIREGQTGPAWYSRSELSAAEQAAREEALAQLAPRKGRPVEGSCKDGGKGKGKA